MIKGILFDKDGTLIDFDALWLAGARTVMPQFVHLLVEKGRVPLRESANIISGKLSRELLAVIGVYDDRVDSRGALAWKTYKEIGIDIHLFLKEYDIMVDAVWVGEILEQLFGCYVNGPQAVLRPVADLDKLFTDLKKQGVYIGLATADTRACANQCLKALNIYQYFDYIGADDKQMAPKPEPDMFNDFARRFNLRPEQIAVAGDTWNDMFFAKRCDGKAIGVLTGTGKREDFADIADIVLESVAQIPEVLFDVSRSVLAG